MDCVFPVYENLLLPQATLLLRFYGCIGMVVVNYMILFYIQGHSNKYLIIQIIINYCIEIIIMFHGIVLAYPGFK